MDSTAENIPHRVFDAELRSALKRISRGIEKESLRVDGDCHLAQTAHPVELGSALCHSFITTDYAEAMLEFITPVCREADEALNILADIHYHSYCHLGKELLWPLSMPCRIATEDQIILARYGSSNIGRMKHVYRQGLKNRYGSMMQVIAGVHYNFSMPENFWPLWQKAKGDRKPLQEFISECYLGLIRNFLRFGWLLTYLFGASPAVDSSFMKNIISPLPFENLGHDTFFLANATSLRMSSLGYRNKAQEVSSISYNSLDKFIQGVRQATNQPNVTFAKIGVKQDGEYRQLNINTLQNEGEFYAPIRPKCTTHPGESLLDKLEQRGIKYVEIRSLDIDPYDEVGISLAQVYFLDVFLTYCLLADSPMMCPQQQDLARQNLTRVASWGRLASLALMDGNTLRSMKDWAEEIFANLGEVARLFDSDTQSNSFLSALADQHEKLKRPELTPSARLLHDMKEQGLEINELAIKLALEHRRKLFLRGYKQIQADQFRQEAAASWRKQHQLEESDDVSFDDFLSLLSQPSSSDASLPDCRTNITCQ
jgi:glutamate--cysteine ligase